MYHSITINGVPIQRVVCDGAVVWEDTPQTILRKTTTIRKYRSMILFYFRPNDWLNSQPREVAGKTIKFDGRAFRIATSSVSNNMVVLTLTQDDPRIINGQTYTIEIE